MYLLCSTFLKINLFLLGYTTVFDIFYSKTGLLYLIATFGKWLPIGLLQWIVKVRL